MRRCRHSLSWNPEWHCGRRGWFGGLCLEHWLDKHHWEWGDDDPGGWSLSVDFGNVNRLYWALGDEWDWVSLFYGNPGVDSVMSVQVPIPQWVTRAARRLAE